MKKFGFKPPENCPAVIAKVSGCIGCDHPDCFMNKSVELTLQHARSLTALVTWFKLFIAKRNEPNAPLTLEYCDELLEALAEIPPKLGDRKNGYIFAHKISRKELDEEKEKEKADTANKN